MGLILSKNSCHTSSFGRGLFCWAMVRMARMVWRPSLIASQLVLALVGSIFSFSTNVESLNPHAILVGAVFSYNATIEAS